jgi:hypothetical protein
MWLYNVCNAMNSAALLLTTHPVSNITTLLKKSLFILPYIIYMYSKCVRIITHISAGRDMTVMIVKLIMI